MTLRAALLHLVTEGFSTFDIYVNRDKLFYRNKKVVLPENTQNAVKTVWGFHCKTVYGRGSAHLFNFASFTRAMHTCMRSVKQSLRDCRGKKQDFTES